MSRGLRGLLREAVQGTAATDLDRLGPLATFEALAALWHSGWLGPGHSSPRATAAEVRQRLRQVARARVSVAEAAALPVGTVVLVTGTLRLESGSRSDDAGETLVIDDDGARASLSPLHWIGSAARDGTVTVLGFTDPRLDPGAAAAGPRRSPTRLWLSSAGLPLMACLVRVPGAHGGAPLANREGTR
jgi:hypothetical protein